MGLIYPCYISMFLTEGIGSLIYGVLPHLKKVNSPLQLNVQINIVFRKFQMTLLSL